MHIWLQRFGDKTRKGKAGAARQPEPDSLC